jgi:hypothetical protein
MKRFVAALLAGLALFALSPADAAYRITFSPGGKIMTFFDKYEAIREAGGHVIIDGPCISACTLVTIIDPAKVCITPRAALAFHSAADINPDGTETYDSDATQIVWHEYPKVIKDLVSAKGWDGSTEHPHLVWLDHDDLSTVYQDCTPDQVAHN